jgi:hypothetical protein
MTASTAPAEGSFLATRRGQVTLALLCAVTFLDVMDGSIVNVALPTIRTHMGFSVQNLQWVVSGYLITYGGFLLLGGRAGDLLGRRRRLLIARRAPGSCGGGAASASRRRGCLRGRRSPVAQKADYLIAYVGYRLRPGPPQLLGDPLC